MNLLRTICPLLKRDSPLFKEKEKEKSFSEPVRYMVFVCNAEELGSTMKHLSKFYGLYGNLLKFSLEEYHFSSSPCFHFPATSLFPIPHVSLSSIRWVAEGPTTAHRTRVIQKVLATQMLPIVPPLVTTHGNNCTYFMKCCICVFTKDARRVYEYDKVIKSPLWSYLVYLFN